MNCLQSIWIPSSKFMSFAQAIWAMVNDSTYHKRESFAFSLIIAWEEFAVDHGFVTRSWLAGVAGAGLIGLTPCPALAADLPEGDSDGLKAEFSLLAVGQQVGARGADDGRRQTRLNYRGDLNLEMPPSPCRPAPPHSARSQCST